MKPLEYYTKAEIISAIRYRKNFDFNSEIAIQSICEKRRHDKAYNHWDKKQRESQAALHDWSAYQKELCERHGGTFKISELSRVELEKLSALCDRTQAADKEEEAAWQKLKEVEDNG